MADLASAAGRTAAIPMRAEAPRHAAIVRVTHWITAACFVALLVTGVEILISHPRLYWGETGNFFTRPLFQFPVPSSRRMVETGYDYVLPDQNGWSRALHFESAWLLVGTGLLYAIWGFARRHFARNIFPTAQDSSPAALLSTIRSQLRFARRSADDGCSYNPLQKLTYALVIFALFPLVIWTGLAMSPAFVSAVPITVTSLGGHQSARTIHFFVSVALLLFFAIHIAMVSIAGFRARMAAMIVGRSRRSEESA